MTDIASLGLKIDSSDAVKAKTNLDALTAASAKAEAGTNKLGATFKTSGVQAKDLLDNTNLSVSARARLAAQLEKQGIATDAVTNASGKLAKGHKAAADAAAGLANASGALGKEQDNAESSVHRFADTLTRRLILGYVISQVRGLASAFVGLNAEIAKMGDLGKLTGLGGGGIQGIMSSAGAKGIGSDTMAAALLAFNQQIPLAKAGIGTLGELLRANKITISDSGDAFFKLADLIKNAKNDTARLSILQQAGLPATLEMVALFKQGSAAIKQQIADTPKLTDAQIEGARILRDRYDEMWNNFVTGGKKAIIDVATYTPAADGWLSKLLRVFSGVQSGEGLSLPGEKNPFATTPLPAVRTIPVTSSPLGPANPSRDYAIEKAIAMDRIAKATTRVGLYGQTPTAQAAKAAKQIPTESKDGDIDRDQHRLRKAA